MHLIWNQYQLEITANNDVVFTRDSAELMCLPLVPFIDGRQLAPGEWRQLNSDHLQLDIADFGAVHLAIREGYPCYWIETEQKRIAELTCFPRSRPTATGWHTFLSDEMDRYWDLNENADVPLSTAYRGMHVDGVPGDPDADDPAGMTDPGDNVPCWIWNIPPRAFAVETGQGWMGFSIPGPISVGVTRPMMTHGIFDLHFQELRPTAPEWGPPRVYFVPSLADPYDALDAHREISEACGLTIKQAEPHPAWWGNPIYKCADELWRINDKQWTIHDEDGKLTTRLTTELWLQWIAHVEKYTGHSGEWNLMMDQLFFFGYGSRNVFDTLGGAEGLRQTIDQLRARGMRVGLYVHLSMLDPSATDFPERHPEAICRPKHADTKVIHGVVVGNAELCYVDWTHPAGRQYMLDLIEWLISDKPGCLNADYLLINNNMAVDPRLFEFHDPDWGIGDLMTMKMTKEVYELAKKIKPDCYVRRQSPGDPYMQPYCDQAALCEEWNGHTTAWYRRANIATRVIDNVIFHTDAWFVTLTKLRKYYFGLSAVCQPEIESVEHAIHPYLLWRHMRQKDYRRVRAGIQAYINAPIQKSDQCRVNFDGVNHPEMWRKRTTGPLAGWYAALALHKRTFVTYSEHEARIASSLERLVIVPLPPGRQLQCVEAVPHEGEPYPFDYETATEGGQTSLKMWVPDANGEAMYIRVRYK